MLRNALNSFRAVSRTPSRSATNPAIAAHSSVLHPPPRPLPYICAACQRRAIHVGRDSRQAVGELTEKQITEFEQHVALMRKKAADIVQKDEALKMAPQLTDRDRDGFFQALMAPPEAPAPKLKALGDLPITTALSLPERLEDSLYTSVRVHLRAENPRWGKFIHNLAKHGGVRGWTVKEVDQLLMAIPPFPRGHVLADLHEMITAAGIPKSRNTYTALMQAHLAKGDTLGARKLFSEMRVAGVDPDAMSYGLLLKAYFKEKDMVNSAHVFTEMEAVGMLPNKVHFTTFIQNCLANKEYATAWEVFNTMKLRSVETGPDQATYSLMIRTAAERKEVEKAMDLFKDMTTRLKIQPNATTYNALMYACALRPDYYTNLWTLANEYVAHKYPMNIRFFTVLMQGCAMNGDLPRARQLMKYMMSRSRDLQPTSTTFVMFLLCYSKYRPPTKFSFKNLSKWHKLDTWQVPEDEKLPAAQIAAAAVTGQSLANQNDFRYWPLPLLDKDFLPFGDILKEATLVLNFVRNLRPEYANTHFINAYLEVLVCQGHYQELRRFFQVEMRNFSDKAETVEITHEGRKFNANRVFRNMKSYDLALKCAEKTKHLNFGTAVYEEREDYLKMLVDLTATDVPKEEFKKYHWLPAKEYERFNRTAERNYIALLAKCDRLTEAVNRIKTSMRRYEWRWSDIKTVYDRAIQKDDMTTAVYIRKVCGKEHV